MNFCSSQELDKHNNDLYKSVDVSFMSDIAPINAALNIGIEKIYGSLIVSYYPTFFPEYETKYIGLGFGIGSNIFISKDLFFNPKIISVFLLGNKNTTFVGLKADFGYKINSLLNVFLGPGITWVTYPIKYFDFHFIGIPYLGRTEINDQNSIIFFGTEIGIRFMF